MVFTTVNKSDFECFIVKQVPFSYYWCDYPKYAVTPSVYKGHLNEL